MPHQVIRSKGYAELSAYAIKLLNDLLAQYNGKNNGDLCCAWTLMQRRNWKSKDTLNRVRRELLEGGWIMITRQGGRNLSTLYALTFYAIDECGGKLDVASTRTPPGDWKISLIRPSGQFDTAIGSITRVEPRN